jgi:hypothetical protein
MVSRMVVSVRDQPVAVSISSPPRPSCNDFGAAISSDRAQQSLFAGLKSLFVGSRWPFATLHTASMTVHPPFACLQTTSAALHRSYGALPRRFGPLHSAIVGQQTSIVSWLSLALPGISRVAGAYLVALGRVYRVIHVVNGRGGRQLASSWRQYMLNIYFLLCPSFRMSCQTALVFNGTPGMRRKIGSSTA